VTGGWCVTEMGICIVLMVSDGEHLFTSFLDI
jgi:hypothetical protein